MPNYPGLNEMSRRRRLAVHLDDADAHYFNDHVRPVIAAEYTLMQEGGMAPQLKSFTCFLADILNRKRVEGNIVLGDPRAFIYPPLNEAHRAGGEPALIAAFADLARREVGLQTHALQHDPSAQAKIANVLAQAAILERLENPSLTDRVRLTLHSSFSLEKTRDETVQAARTDYCQLAGIPAYSPEAATVTSADIRAFAASIDKLYPQVPDDYMARRPALLAKAHSANDSAPGAAL